MDNGMTVGKVKKEYLCEKHPDWNESTLRTHISEACYLYQNTIALSFWKCFADDASMEAAKADINNYLTHEAMSDRAEERTRSYYADLAMFKEFLDSKGGVKTTLDMSMTVRRRYISIAGRLMTVRSPLRMPLLC